MANITLIDPTITSPTTQPRTISQSRAKSSRRPPKHRPEDMCRGRDGQTAEGHTVRKNAGCAIDACSKCCVAFLPQGIFCGKHESMAKTKAKKLNNQAAQPVLSQLPLTNNDTTPSGAGTNATARLTQAVRSFYRELSSPEYAKFRSISIQKQAEERLLQDRMNIARKNVSMFVWSSLDKDHTSKCSFWRVPAPQWPLLALQESEVFTALVKNQLGEDWNGTFQVWNKNNYG
ncbi:uncharacterized protein MELLADRAFT_93878 [Melampsora larici-populina 98AG31]|uniref:Uncharacterized protein n=1 Tax=Melampsora larici-populina (strain 98AG31 / pathotype 3-4-7) TaxID=747676 RepID=F4S5L2_MELLP|nr:uncharacterized protein MELLADRAFT_93878 [Melampsora larici-populina 98AG31]EGG00047.1 hypothetical protein MELLADRAFT_93878 [Melampsora larici-populina 98AG31]